MKSLGFMLGLLVILSGILFLTPDAKGDHEYVADGPIIVEEHWIDLFQQANKRTLEIDEYFFINNTGFEPFSGEFFLWLDMESDIIAKCCGNAPDMACRLQTAGAMACFNFAQSEDNIYVGEPFYSNDIISYYDQREQLKIIAASVDNDSIVQTLSLNVNLGGSSVLRNSSDHTENDGIFLHSKHDTIGIEFDVGENMPNNITVVEQIEIYNNQTENVTLNLSVIEVPLGWKIHLLYDNVSLSDVSLAPLDNINVSLLVTVPSYIAPIKVSYINEIGDGGNDNTGGTYEKQYLYYEKRVEYFIFALSDKGVSVSNDLQIVHPTPQGEPELNEQYNRFWYVAQASNILANSQSTITFQWNNTQDVLSLLALMMLIVLILLLIGTPLIRGRNKISSSSLSDSSGDSPGNTNISSVTVPSKEETNIHQVKPHNDNKNPKPKASVKKRVESLSFILAKIKNDHKNGLLPDETYTELEAKYQNELSLALEELEEHKGLETKRRKFTLAIERLKEDHRNGRLDDDTFNTLIKDYEKMRDIQTTGNQGSN